MKLSKKMTLTTLVKFLNKTKTKKTGNPFTISDVQAYARRGHLPKYMGGNEILSNNDFEGVILYSIKIS